MASSGTAQVTLPAADRILIVREFDAPAALLWRALTTPELVKRWWNAKRGEVTLVEMDLRVGGRWRQVMVADGGVEVAFHGEYREIVPERTLVSTEVYEGAPGGDENGTLNTLTLEEADGRTTLTVLIECPSPEVRDAIVASGMEAGLQDAYDLLEEVAASLA